MPEYLHDDETHIPIPIKRIHLSRRPIPPRKDKKCTFCKRTLSKDLFYIKKTKNGISCYSRCKDCHNFDIRRRKKNHLSLRSAKMVNYNTDLGAE